jgi:hypothetical protein
MSDKGLEFFASDIAAMNNGLIEAAPKATPKTAWDAAQTAPDFLKVDTVEPEWIARDLLAPGSVTFLASPRGLGKTHVAHRLAIAIATGGEFRGEVLKQGRVLLIDRDNPRREIRRRLARWGGADADALDVMSRDEAPPLTDAAAWAIFPFDRYLAVILDSLSVSTEGVEERDGGKTGKAIAPLLDLARRGSAVLVLANCTKIGEVMRGSGVIGDRADIVFEVRDATSLKLDPKRDHWIECLPESSDASWVPRARRRGRRSDYRLAFTASKFRVAEEPKPFAVELRLDAESPWSLRDVTGVIESEHEQLKGDVEVAREEARNRAIATLKAALAERPLTQAEAAPVVAGCGLSRDATRAILADGIGAHWLRSGSGRKGEPFTFHSLKSSARITDTGSPTGTAISETSIRAANGAQGPQESAYAEPLGEKWSR